MVDFSLSGLTVKSRLVSVVSHYRAIDGVIVPDAIMLHGLSVGLGSVRVGVPFTIVVLLSMLSRVVISKVSHLSVDLKFN